jgi:rhamnogalacturonan endolyase
LNDVPLTGPTHYFDRGIDLGRGAAYFMRPVIGGQEREPTPPFRLPANASAQPYLSVPIQPPPGYHANDCSVGDLDGDGEYEIVVHMVGRGRDNSQGGVTTDPIFHAYKLDGTRFWEINLGKNIREGAHYTQFMVYDLDGDGRAEMVCKTADGTVDGRGKVIGDAAADHRTQPAAPAEAKANPTSQQVRRRGDRSGFVLSGQEYLTVFDGLTGAALTTVDFLPPRGGNGSGWGDSSGNRVDRFLACVAYLDGQRPSVVMCRGYYTRAVLAAWDWRSGKLTSRWVFDTEEGQPGNAEYRGQGNHNLTVADVDGDGKDEIIYGACVIDDNGLGLYSTKLGHGDAMHVTDHDPARPGLEVWSIHENERSIAGKPGATFRSAATGEVYFSALAGQDVGRGTAADIDPRHPGSEMWTNNGGLWNAKGILIGNRPRVANMAIWWDGDLLRELLDGVNISKWDYENEQETRLFSGRDVGLASNNGTKSNPCLSADILGDWREELVARSADGEEIRIYTTTIPTEHRLPTLMHDPHYRLSVAWQNVAYNQPPHTGFHLGVGMRPPPRPTISPVQPK